MKKIIIISILTMVSSLSFAQWTDYGSYIVTNDRIQQSSKIYLPFSNGNNYIRAASTSNFTYFDSQAGVGIGHQSQYSGYSFHVQGKTNLNGDLGISIGNTLPQAPLHVKGNAGTLLLEGTDHSFISFYPDGYSSGRKSFLGFPDASSTTVTMKNEISGGDVEISVTDSGAINLIGSVWAHEVVVQLTDPWPDYVFGKTYEKLSLTALEQYIQTNHHLPNVPSAQQIKEGGVNLGQMDAVLLEKIEELTLYTIEQQKQIEAQNKLIEEQGKMLEKLLKSTK